jgi:hypothetical protein
LATARHKIENFNFDTEAKKWAFTKIYFFQRAVVYRAGACTIKLFTAVIYGFPR